MFSNCSACVFGQGLQIAKQPKLCFKMEKLSNDAHLAKKTCLCGHVWPPKHDWKWPGRFVSKQFKFGQLRCSIEWVRSFKPKCQNFLPKWNTTLNQPKIGATDSNFCIWDPHGPASEGADGSRWIIWSLSCCVSNRQAEGELHKIQKIRNFSTLTIKYSVNHGDLTQSD